MSKLSTAELAIYAMLTIPAIFILFKHGKPGLLGWFYLQAFFMLRIVGGALALSGSSSASIVSNIGLSPLILAAAGILHEARIYRCPTMNGKVEWIKVILYHFLVTSGVALLAAGASGLQGSSPSSSDENLVKVGIAILTVAWVVLSGWAIISLRSSGCVRSTSAQRLGTLLLYSVLLCIIFIGIRVIYSLVALTSNNPKINPSTGSLAIRVVLGFLPELVSALIFLAFGFYTRNIRGVSRADPGYEQAGSPSIPLNTTSRQISK
ncbi:hypothetical protein BGZ63DRAFT_246888 [Mariannaea sp. PMI_226]|nr:hypothetical protein BGZ63DRAFT_246888 [Mariannaea sp. PMI_226]